MKANIVGKPLLSQFDVATGREEDILERLDGVSGGPVFRIVTTPLLLMELVGVISEGTVAFGHPVFKFARLDRIGANGPLAPGL